MAHIKFLFLVPFFILNFSSLKAQKVAGYKLVWADEFNKNGAPDTSKWTYEKGFVRNRSSSGTSHKMPGAKMVN